jgi:N-acetyl-alpha-D-muramate 1-phosphate uridylyltransferase
MILAAGLGRRMGALSDDKPKPLTDVLGVCLLDRLRRHARVAGVQKLVVNVHHLADQVEAHLSGSIKDGSLIISDERSALLETGGGVKKALPLLGADPFFVINGDALWVDAQESNLLRLKKAWDPRRMDALLLLVPTEAALGYDGVGDFFATADFGIGGGQPIRFRGDAPSAPYIFGGVQLLEPSLYHGMPSGAFSNRDIYHKAFANGRLYGLPIEGHWMHVGTKAAIAEAEAKLKSIGAN